MQQNEKFLERNFVNLSLPHKVVLFSGNCRKCCFICHWKLISLKFNQDRFLIKWKVPNQRVVSATLDLLLFEDVI